jgi:hypothetical protein
MPVTAAAAPFFWDEHGLRLRSTRDWLLYWGSCWMPPAAECAACNQRPFSATASILTHYLCSCSAHAVCLLFFICRYQGVMNSNMKYITFIVTGKKPATLEHANPVCRDRGRGVHFCVSFYPCIHAKSTRSHASLPNPPGAMREYTHTPPAHQHATSSQARWR